jgi:hypothetical protein
MGKTSKKTDPQLWEKVKEDVTAGGKGGVRAVVGPQGPDGR